MFRKVAYRDLRRHLERLGFSETKTPRSHILLENKPTDTKFLLREYNEEEPVSQKDIVVIRRFLDERGIQSADNFERWLAEPAPSTDSLVNRINTSGQALRVIKVPKGQTKAEGLRATKKLTGSSK